MSWNQIDKLENISSLKRLKELNIYNCKITDIESLNQLSELKEIHIFGNNITNIKPLGDAPKLLKIGFCRKNQYNNKQLDELKSEFAQIGFNSFEIEHEIIHFLKEK